MITRRGFLRLVWTGIGACVALGGYATGIEAMGSPRTTRFRPDLPEWPAALGLKIVVLADFHACEPWMTHDRIAAICDQANALRPDLVLLLGDFVSGMRLVTDEVDPLLWSRAIARLSAPLGVHAVLGNHDYWSDDAVQFQLKGKPFAQLALEDVGIPVYVNQAVRLEKDGVGFWLAGLGDQLAYSSLRAAERNAIWGIDDLAGTLSQVTDDAPVLLMAHEPDIFPEVPARVALTLSGHTHGGQVNIFGWKPVVPSRYGSRYAGGHVVENGRHLIVSKGLGCTGLPVRFGAWPEILEIDLGRA